MGEKQPITWLIGDLELSL